MGPGKLLQCLLWGMLVAGCKPPSPVAQPSPPPVPSPSPSPSPTPTPGPATTQSYGVLLADPQHLSTDQAAGVHWAELEVGWDTFETSPGHYTAAALPLSQLQAYKNAGWKVELSLGLHYPPAWATQLEPWQDQNGGTYTAEANWFNATVQQDVWNIIHQVMTAVGPQNIDAVRIGGLNENGELLYPSTPSYRYVAFSRSALAGTALVPANPVPGCKPPSCSAADAKTFLSWYVGALAAFGNFQVRALRDAGYRGDVDWLMPGVGMRPSWTQSLVSNGLDLSSQYPDDYQISAGGADWPTLIAAIADQGPNTVITCTSLNDDSAVGAIETSPNVDDWSSAHWIASNADLHGLRKSGENKGDDNAAAMDLAFAKMKEFGYRKLMWAWDGELYGGFATQADYASRISANP